jgi:hypothetical protein
MTVVPAVLALLGGPGLDAAGGLDRVVPTWTWKAAR